jgi:hypothetical protein
MLLTICIILFIIIGFCQSFGDVYIESSDDIDFIIYGRLGQVADSPFLLRSLFINNIEDEFNKIYRQIIVSAVVENKTDTAFTILDGNCDASNYQEIQKGVINILRAKLVGLRFIPTTTEDNRFNCYEIMRAEW